jgi:hypothetical protein
MKSAYQIDREMMAAWLKWIKVQAQKLSKIGLVLNMIRPIPTDFLLTLPLQ